MSKKNNLNYIPASAKTAAQKQEEAKKNKRRDSYELSAEAKSRLLKKRIWTLSVISLSLILVLTLSIIFATYQPTLYSEKTNTPPTEDAQEGLIKNQDFNLSALLYNGLHSQALQYPFMPESWSLSNKSINDSVAGIISRDEDEKANVIDGLKANGLTDDQINKLLAIDASENLADDADKSVLLINNKAPTDVRVYSNSFSVPANGYLEITVKIRTEITSGDGAYIALKTTTSDSAEAELQFTRVNTNGVWQEYKFFVEGSKTSSKTLYLFAGLGTDDNKVQGWAEIDFAKAVSAKKVSYIENAEKTDEELLAANTKTKSYVKDINDENIFDIYPVGMLDSNGNAMTPKTNSELGELPFYGTPEVYGITNNDKQGDFMQLSYNVPLNQSSASPYYRFSFWAKTEDIQNNTGAYFYVNLFDQNGNRLASYTKSFDLIKTSTDEDDTNSGWAEYSFLLQPDNTQAYEAEFVFSLGALKCDSNGVYSPADNPLKTTGSLYITELELKEIYQSEYTSASEGSSIVKVSITESTSTGLITNGNFDSPVANAYTGETTDVPSGYDPNGWSIKFPSAKDSDGNIVYTPHGNDDLLFGVLPKNADNVKKQEYLGANYEGFFGHTGDDNILAIRTKTNTAIGFVSNKFSLTANSYYIISFIVKTESANNVNAYLTGDIEQAFKVGDIAEDKYYAVEEYLTNGYTKYNFIIKTGDKAKSVALELWVGDKDAKYENDAWTGLAATDSIVAFDEAKTQTIDQDKFDDIVNDKVDGKNVFTKTETKEPVKDEDGNDTDETETTDVSYTTEMKNVWVRDFSYVDKSDAIDSDTDEEETTNPTAPIDWLLLSSLILSVAVIIFLITMIVKKFKKVKKYDETPDDPDYKK